MTRFRPRVFEVWSRVLILVVALAASAVTAGCANLPILGDIGSRIEPFMPKFIQDRFFAQQDTAPVVNQARLVPRERRTIAQAVGGVASSSAPVPVATENPKVLYEHELSVNIEFDHLRTLGLEQLYDGQTADALKSFRAALVLRPQDHNVEDLIHLAEHPAGSASSQGSQAGFDSGGSQYDSQAPALPLPPTYTGGGNSPWTSSGGAGGGTTVSPFNAAGSAPGTTGPGFVNLPSNVHLAPVPQSTPRAAPPPPPAFQVPTLHR